MLRTVTGEWEQYAATAGGIAGDLRVRRSMPAPRLNATRDVLVPNLDGTTLTLSYSPANWPSRASGTPTTPTFGSIVANG